MEINDKVEMALRDGKPTIIFDNTRRVDQTILAQPLRNYFIQKVKKPLMKALVVLSRRYPQPTKENTGNIISHSILEIFQEFHERNSARPDMMRGAERVFVDEVEHDRVYYDMFNWILEQVILKILEGKWGLRNNKMLYWKEPDSFLHDTEQLKRKTRDTVISRMIEHREEIKAILRI